MDLLNESTIDFAVFLSEICICRFTTTTRLAIGLFDVCAYETQNLTKKNNMLQPVVVFCALSVFREYATTLRGMSTLITTPISSSTVVQEGQQPARS